MFTVEPGLQFSAPATPPSVGESKRRPTKHSLATMQQPVPIERAEVVYLDTPQLAVDKSTSTQDLLG